MNVNEIELMNTNILDPLLSLETAIDIATRRGKHSFSTSWLPSHLFLSTVEPPGGFSKVYD